MLLAKPAVLCELEAVRIVLLVLHCVVVALLAFRAGKSYFDAHCRFPPAAAGMPATDDELKVRTPTLGRRPL